MVTRTTKALNWCYKFWLAPTLRIMRLELDRCSAKHENSGMTQCCSLYDVGSFSDSLSNLESCMVDIRQIPVPAL